MRTGARDGPGATELTHAGRWGLGLPVVRAFYRRPYLMIAIVAGIVLYAVSGLWVGRNVTRALIGWDSAVFLFIGLIVRYVSNSDIEHIKQRAIKFDEGARLILVLTVFAAVASIVALVEELSEAKGRPHAALHVALAALTIILSWLFMQFVFALHYAHVYYLAERDGEPQGGLNFGMDEEPDYWDFVHFAIVIGATSQTADVTFTSRHMRRIGTLHTLVAFGFNTAILATMINLAASLF